MANDGLTPEGDTENGDVRVRWNADEWFKIATHLNEKYPELNIMSPDAATVGYPGLNETMILAAGREALPEDRHRTSALTSVSKRKIHEAIIKANNPQVPEPPRYSKRIIWSKQERKRHLARLEGLYPGVIGNLDKVTPDMLRHAEDCLPEPRRKGGFPSMSHERDQLKQVVDDLDMSIFKPYIQKVKEEMEPPIPESDDETPALAADESGTRKLIRWTFSELVLVAKQLHEDQPYSNYPYRESLAGLHAEEVRLAQRVLPENRRRTITTIQGIREQLQEAMAVVRSEVEAERIMKAQLQRQTETVTEPEPAAPPPVAPIPQSAQPLGELIAQAAAPLFKVMWEQFSAVVIPQIADALEKKVMSRIEDMVLTAATTPHPSMPPASAAAPVEQAPAPSHSAYVESLPDEDPFAHQPPAHYRGPEGVVRKSKVGIIGPRNAVGALEDTFPFIDFEFIAKPSELAPALRQCEKIIGIQNFVTQAAQNILRKTPEAKEKYIVINGSKSAVARQINVWLNAGVLANDQPQSHAH